MTTSLTRRVTATAVSAAALLTTATAFAATPAQAFTNDNAVTVSGVRYYAKAYSCNVYWRSCSWNSSISISKSKSYTHRADVKANGFKLSITISKGGGVTITGNSTSLVTAKRSSYGTSSYISGVAKPSIFSVSVSARTRLAAGGQNVSSGWTTW
ncbi:hypothetical protein [Micropruina sonneratiae]|uniref:hypothetical protein n=1 Tax=Micropruina sonneratiae TaxID=2986940 RepID=UPI002225C9DA|nr:hypothetical protein [Micropruina sp. KQZ13P-5]MCW3156929.1 hypothetical protein [Micropruina sp. KQZ13P-5]